MPDDLSGRRREAALDNYATDENLRKRMSLFEYAVPTEPQTQLYELFDWPPGATVLDVGCGNGLWTGIAAQRTGSGTVIGLDNSAGMLAAIAARPEPILPVLADTQDVPLRDDAVDVVLATWMLYHVRDKAAAFSEIVRVLRPGGRLIAATNSGVPLEEVDEMIRESAEQVAGRAVPQWIEPLDFTLENGVDLLGPWFERVDTYVGDSRFEVPVPDPIVGLAESMRAPILAEVGDDLDFDAFLGALAAALEIRMARGPITFSRRVGFFVARA